jgi:hypothetical protein
MYRKSSKNSLLAATALIASFLVVLFAVPLHGQTLNLERTLPIPTPFLQKGHSWEGVQIGVLDSTQAVLSLGTRYPKGKGDQSVASTRYLARYATANNTADTAELISPLLLRFMGEKIYPAGFMAMDSVAHFFYSQFLPKKKSFRLFAYTLNLKDTAAKTSFNVLFEIPTSDPDQVAFRFAQTGAHFGLAFMQLEDDKNDRAILTWKVYTQKLKTVFQRTEKINFGGGNVALFDFSLSPELVGLTTLEHSHSKGQPDGLAYYVFSKERTSVYKGELFVAQNQALFGTWTRYNADSAHFVLGGILAPSAFRIPERIFHFQIPLQRVDLPEGGIFPLPAEWVSTWKEDKRPFGLRYYNQLNSAYRIRPSSKNPLSMVYLAGGAYKNKPFQSDLLVLGTNRSGIAYTARMERNLRVDGLNSAVGLVTLDNHGAFVLAHGAPETLAPSKKPVDATGPVLTQVLPNGTFERIALPLPLDATETYFYEGVEQIDQTRFVLPYKTTTGISLAVYAFPKQTN